MVCEAPEPALVCHLDAAVRRPSDRDEVRRHRHSCWLLRAGASGLFRGPSKPDQCPTEPEALGGLTPIGSGVNSNDVFMIKLDSSGSPVWAKSFGSTSTGLDKGYGIAVDVSGAAPTRLGLLLIA